MDESLSPVLIPIRTVRLAGRYLPQLLTWYTLGQLVHDAAIYLGAKVAEHGSHVNLFTSKYTYWKLLGYSFLPIAELALLASIVMMLHTVRKGLPSYHHKTLEPDHPVLATTYPHSNIYDVVAKAVFPFLAYYEAWDLILQDQKEYAQQGVTLHSDATLLIIPSTGVTLLVTAAIFIARLLCEHGFERTESKALGLLTAVFESAWMFFFVITVKRWLTDAHDWVTSRVAWERGGDLLTSGVGWVEAHIPGLPVATVQAGTSQLRADLPFKDIIGIPLIWFVIAAVVYGQEVAGSQLFTAENLSEGRIGRAIAWAPSGLLRAVELLSVEVRKKYVPALNGLRLVLTAGVRFFLAFCICYVAAQALMYWAFIGVTHLIGGHDTTWWLYREIPLAFARDAVIQILEVCILATAFDMVLRRRLVAHRAAVGKQAQNAGQPQPVGAGTGPDVGTVGGGFPSGPLSAPPVPPPPPGSPGLSGPSPGFGGPGPGGPGPGFGGPGPGGPGPGFGGPGPGGPGPGFSGPGAGNF